MKYSVLIVDDEKVFRDYIRSMKLWGKSGFAIMGEAGGGKEALEMMKNQKYDVVILDVSMPDLNGVALCAKIAEKYPTTAMIGISSFDSYDYVREILKSGAYDYILKGRLTESLLEKVLENIKVDIQNTSAWDGKKKWRSQVSDWLFEDGFYPFTSDNFRKLAAIIRLNGNPFVHFPEYEAVIAGIGRILESESDQEMDILALSQGRDCFVVLYRFYKTVSEKEIFRRTSDTLAVSAERIRAIYGVSLIIDLCPVFFSDNAMRTFILHKMIEREERSDMTDTGMSLTIDQQKRMIMAIERRSGEEADEVIGEIYGRVSKENVSSFIVITKELLDMIKRTAIEYQIELDFLPAGNSVFRYMNGKSRERIVENISGVYRNVLREIREREVRQKYSEIVGNAVIYIRENFYRQIGLSQIADSIGVNSSYLSRLFHKETGSTITDFLNSTRVEEAKGMLKEGIPTKEIAKRCGFKNYSYFLKIFKDCAGMTPRGYSKKNG